MLIGLLWCWNVWLHMGNLTIHDLWYDFFLIAERLHCTRLFVSILILIALCFCLISSLFIGRLKKKWALSIIWWIIRRIMLIPEVELFVFVILMGMLGGGLKYIHRMWKDIIVNWSVNWEEYGEFRGNYMRSWYFRLLSECSFTRIRRFELERYRYWWLVVLKICGICRTDLLY